jgi:hypothetical protein
MTKEQFNAIMEEVRSYSEDGPLDDDAAYVAAEDVLDDNPGLKEYIKKTYRVSDVIGWLADEFSTGQHHTLHQRSHHMPIPVPYKSFTIYDAETGEIFLNRGTQEESSLIIENIIYYQHDNNALIDVTRPNPDDPTNLEIVVINYDPKIEIPSANRQGHYLD